MDTDTKQQNKSCIVYCIAKDMKFNKGNSIVEKFTLNL